MPLTQESVYEIAAHLIMEPRDVILQWVDFFNRQNADELADLYAEDSINHQIPTGEFRGRQKIREMFFNEFQRYEMECQVENLFQDGDWAILEWKDPKGLRGCGFFKIQDDHIVFQRGYWDRLSFSQQQGS